MNDLLLITKNKVLRFLVSGTTGAIVQIGLLFLFTHFLGIWYIISGLIAFLCSQTVSFMLQKFWTFKNFNNDKIHHQAFWYVIIGIFNLFLNTTLLYLFVDFVHIHYLIAQVIGSLALAITSFFMYRLIFDNKMELKQALLVNR